MSLSSSLFAVNSLCMRAKTVLTRDGHDCFRGQMICGPYKKAVPVLPSRLRSSIKLLGSIKISGSRLAAPIL